MFGSWCFLTSGPSGSVINKWNVLLEKVYSFVDQKDTSNGKLWLWVTLFSAACVFWFYVNFKKCYLKNLKKNICIPMALQPYLQ